MRQILLFLLSFSLFLSLKAQPNSSQWVWLGGDSSISSINTEQFGIWGNRGVSSMSYFPGARFRSISWKDADGNFWLFGGQGFAASGNSGFLNDLWKYNVNTKEWQWVSGSNSINQTGVYGTRGVSNMTNMPGARNGSVGWTDGSGNLWLFGGLGYATNNNTGYLNDLWKYDPVSNQWTWVSGSNTINSGGVYGTKGVASVSNLPSSRQAATAWKYQNGQFWLMGGYNNNRLNDLWKYDPVSNLWTWMNGSNSLNQLGTYGLKGIADVSNAPGSRFDAFGCVDPSGDLWYMGGSGYDVNGSVSVLNDLWKYNLATNEWTWISGSNTVNQAGVYGTKGVASSRNVPGARLSSLIWADGEGKLWLYGGSNGIYFNDIWNYDPVANIWTWVQGTNLTNQPGSYGVKGVTTADNLPGSRQNSVQWVDASGRLYLFGGIGFNQRLASLYLNDLWMYDLLSNQWTWIGGSNNYTEPGVYGTKNVSNAANKPGGRRGAVSLIDRNGKFLLFGGQGYGEIGFSGFLNDLFLFDPVTREWTWKSGSNTTGQTAVYGTRGVPNAANIPNARQSSMGWVDASNNLWIMGGVNNSGSYHNDLWRFNFSTNQWTWMNGSNGANQPAVYGTKGVSGASNTPSSRQSSAYWTDLNGDFWLFGGFGRTITNNQNGLMNDLWMFNPSTNQWTWYGGSGTLNGAAFYGIKGEAGSGYPGARQDALTWIDANGNLWLMGGNGIDDAGNQGLLNDLWKYNPVTNLWTWVSGSKSANQNGIYGILNEASSVNAPGGRQTASTWTDNAGNLWLMGGLGFGNSGGANLLNDFWKYDPATSKWTWAGGSNSTAFTYSYGQKGISSASNMPAARSGAANWIDADGNLWLLGGLSRFDNTNTNFYISDLWRYQLSCEVTSAFTINDTIQCLAGNTFEFVNKSKNNIGTLSYQWSFGDGTGSTDKNPVHSFADAGTYSVKLLVQNQYCTDTVRKTIEVIKVPAQITADGSLSFCSGNSVLLKANTGSGLQYTWKKNGIEIPGETAATYKASVSGTYTVDVKSSSTACNSESSPVEVVVKPLPSRPEGAAAQSFCVTTPVSSLQATGNDIRWYSESTGGSLLPFTTAMISGVTYFGSQTVNGCESSDRLAVTVTIRNTPAPEGLATQTFCNAASVSDLSATGNDIKWFESSTGGVALSVSSSLQNGRTYYASQTIEGCESVLRLPVKVIINVTEAPTGISEQSYCKSVTVQSLSITGTNVKWYETNSSVTALAGSTVLTGNTILYATQTINGCESALRFPVTVRVVPNPSAPTGSLSQSFCGQPTIASLVAAGTSVKWYEASTGGSPLPSGLGLENGKVYYASQTVSGCESESRLAVTVTINNLNAPTGSQIQSFCGTATIASLVAIGNDIRWYTNAAGGASLAPTTALQNEATYYASQTINGCESSLRLPVKVIITVTPVPTGATTQTFCKSATIGQLSVTGSNIKWYATNSSSAVLASTTVISSNGTYYASQTVNGCESTDRLAVTVSITAPPAAPTGTASQSFCGSATIANLSATGTDIRWYTVSTGGLSVAPGTSLVSGSVYYASQTINGCESDARLGVTATINPALAKPVITINGFELISSATSGNQWYLNGNPINGATGVIYKPHEPGIYTVKVVGGICESAFSDIVNLLNSGGEYIRLQPNPVKDQLQVLWMLREYTNLSAKIYTSNGRLVASYPSVTNGTFLNVAVYQPGQYLLHLTTPDGEKRFVYTFIKM